MLIFSLREREEPSQSTPFHRRAEKLSSHGEMGLCRGGCGMI